MSKLPLDLSKFRKVGSDKNTSTFRHYEGHEIKIAHGKLSSKLREQLDKMPVASPKKMAEGGVAEDAGAAIHDFVDDAIPHLSSPIGTIMSPAIGFTRGLMGGSSNPSPEAGATPDDALPSSQSGVLAGVSPTAASVPSDTADPYGINANADTQIKALNEQKLGQQGVEIAKGKEGLAQAEQEGNFQQGAENRLSENEISQNVLDTERENLVHDINNFHVDPNRVLENMSTGRHILNAVGLVLGGFGQGLAGGSNPAYDYIQSQISRDIESQKAELGKKENLLSHNIQATQSFHAGVELTRLQANDLLSSHLRQEAAKAANPIAQAELLNIAGKTDAQSAVIRQNARMQSMMMGNNAQTKDPESQFQSRMQFLRMNGGAEMAKDLEAKHVPGVGQASKEVPSEVMKELVGRQDLQNQVGTLRQWAQENSGSLNPATQNYGAALAKQVQDAYRRANGQGVFREAEADFVKGIVDQNPTKFLNALRVDPKYKALEEGNQASLNALKKGYGLPVSSGTGSSPQYKVSGGVKYMRGPNGEAIRVP